MSHPNSLASGFSFNLQPFLMRGNSQILSSGPAVTPFGCGSLVGCGVRCVPVPLCDTCVLSRASWVWLCTCAVDTPQWDGVPAMRTFPCARPQVQGSDPAGSPRTSPQVSAHLVSSVAPWPADSPFLFYCGRIHITLSLPSYPFQECSSMALGIFTFVQLSPPSAPELHLPKLNH